jgi:hypothetical protein
MEPLEGLAALKRHMLYHLSYRPMKSPIYEEENQKAVVPPSSSRNAATLKSVASQTLQWYQRSFKAFDGAWSLRRQ